MVDTRLVEEAFDVQTQRIVVLEQELERVRTQMGQLTTQKAQQLPQYNRYQQPSRNYGHQPYRQQYQQGYNQHGGQHQYYPYQGPQGGDMPMAMQPSYDLTALAEMIAKQSAATKGTTEQQQGEE